MILVDQAAIGGLEAGRVREIFHADRQAVQDAEIIASDDGLLGIARRLARDLLVERDHGVDRAVRRPDAHEATVEQLDGRDLLAADETAQLDCGKITKLAHGR